MKYCSRCEKEKSLDEFTKDRRRKDGLSFYCKSCISEIRAKEYQKRRKYYIEKQKKRYRENREYYKKKARQRRNRLLTEFRNWKSELGCNYCPESHPACIDFHHPNSKKESIIKMVMRGINLKKIKERIKNEECISICSNCHRKIHYKEYK